MRRRHAVTTAALLTALVCLTGASCRHEPTPATSRSAPGDAEPGTTERRDDLRRSVAPVPAGMRFVAMDFADHDRGYALFARCTGDAQQTCEPAVTATFDGGGSWLARRLPAGSATGFELRVLDRDSIAVLAAGVAWWVSHNGGAAFDVRAATTVPPEVTLAGGVYRSRGRLVRLAADASERPVPVQPPLDLGRPSTLVERGDRLWLAGVDASGALATAYSPDGGATWPVSQVVPAAGQGGRLVPADGVRLAVTAREPYEVWLAATDTAGGRQVRRLWRFDASAGRWVDAPVEGDVVEAAGAAAVPGALLVANAFGVGAVRDNGRTWRFPVGPREIVNVRVMPDGWVLGVPGDPVRANDPGRRWLCRCDESTYRWIEVVLSAP